MRAEDSRRVARLGNLAAGRWQAALASLLTAVVLGLLLQAVLVAASLQLSVPAAGLDTAVWLVPALVVPLMAWLLWQRLLRPTAHPVRDGVRLAWTSQGMLMWRGGKGRQWQTVSAVTMPLGVDSAASRVMEPLCALKVQGAYLPIWPGNLGTELASDLRRVLQSRRARGGAHD